MEIRPVRAADRDEWMRMRMQLYRSRTPQEIDDWLQKADSGGTPEVGVAVLVAVRGNGKLAGVVEIGLRSFAEGCSSSPVPSIEGWYVDSDLRRRGLGRRLIEAAEAWARRRGYTEIASDTELANDVSLRAHLALGYEEVERQICFRKTLR